MLSIKHDEHMFELKYRPQTIEECILPAHDKEVFMKLAKKGKLPHLILQSNSPGTGKTTVALALCNDINADVMFVNGSGAGIDFIKNEVVRFATSRSIEGRPKVVVLDEFDRTQLAEAQRYLRSFMETTGKNCSFIITANNLEGIVTPLRSRMQIIKFGTPTGDDIKSMMRQMITRCLAICENEKIAVESPKVIAALVKKNFPDFRKTIGSLDHYSTKGVIDEGILSIVLEDRGSIQDVIDALKSGDIKTLRGLAPKYAPDYPFFVDKLIDEVYPQVGKMSKLNLIDIVGENNQMHGLAANVEVHMMYMFTRLILAKLEWL